jgi:hypothetical protein
MSWRVLCIQSTTTYDPYRVANLGTKCFSSATGLISLKMSFLKNLTDEDIAHLAALTGLEVLTLNVSHQLVPPQ